MALIETITSYGTVDTLDSLDYYCFNMLVCTSSNTPSHYKNDGALQSQSILK